MQEAEKISNFTAAVSNLNSTLKKVPARVESCAWARSVRFLQRNIVRWAQRHDLAYFRDATSVLYSRRSTLGGDRKIITRQSRSATNWRMVVQIGQQTDLHNRVPFETWPIIPKKNLSKQARNFFSPRDRLYGILLRTWKGKAQHLEFAIFKYICYERNFTAVDLSPSVTMASDFSVAPSRFSMRAIDWSFKIWQIFDKVLSPGLTKTLHNHLWLLEI